MTVEGTKKTPTRQSENDYAKMADGLDLPKMPNLEQPYDLLVTGVGGTGVVTIGALITMAAHLENRGASVLDFTGFAQKFGPVLSFVRMAGARSEINQVRIDAASADALIGCDIVVSSSPKASAVCRNGTKTVLNLAEMPTGDIVLHRDASLRTDDRHAAIAGTVGANNVTAFDANRLAERHMGDTVFANVIMLGAAWQKGLVPVTFAGLQRAIELNGVAIEANKQAFALGRLMAAAPDRLNQSAETGEPGREPVSALTERFAAHLRDYQDAEYAGRFMQTIDRVRNAEGGARQGAVTEAAARSLFRLMAYKDEYEVARLHRDRTFRDRLAGEFEPGFKVTYHLAPPLLSGATDPRGRPLKREYGAWMGGLFFMLKRMKALRGHLLDPFGHTAERHAERDLIVWYEQLVDKALERLTREITPKSPNCFRLVIRYVVLVRSRRRRWLMSNSRLPTNWLSLTRLIDWRHEPQSPG